MDMAMFFVSCRGRTRTLVIYICYNLFTVGRVFMHTGCHYQKWERMLKLTD